MLNFPFPVVRSALSFRFIVLWLMTSLTCAAAGETDALSSAPDYVGGQACAGCHQTQFTAWLDSHHDWAMKPATEASVLGDFSDVEFRHQGVSSRFYRREGKFMVRTDGPDGAPSDYEIRYSLGVYPLQRYLVPLEGGRLQVLGIAWDSRPKEEGGQRWFHLYPTERVSHEHPLHWTGIQQNWNHMCAGCHSTGLHKRFDSERDAFDTRWSDINVSCEACHGPGSDHLIWAQRTTGWERLDNNRGLVVQFDDRAEVTWTRAKDAATARRSGPPSSGREIDKCARCHSRRTTLTDDSPPGEPLLQSHEPALLTEGLYFADGQAQDEVYVYGSFLQSKMHGAGVTCSDCHEPHSLELRAKGNTLCFQCHAPGRYGSREHHHHSPRGRGGQCVSCHMPLRTYMVVDRRRDHSLCIPRPDLSLAWGTPNVCDQCHVGRTPEWAVKQFGIWYDRSWETDRPYLAALWAAREGMPGAGDQLVEVLEDDRIPAIVRATAVRELARYPGSSALPAIAAAAQSTDPLLRWSALEALQPFADEDRLSLAEPALTDPVRAVRIRAARLLAAVPEERLGEGKAAARDRGLAEYVAAQRRNADRPEAHLNLGMLYGQGGDWKRAETAYRQAIELAPWAGAAYLNLADLHRMRGDDGAGEAVLNEGLMANPNAAMLHHALGLLKLRGRDMEAALPALRQAVELAPQTPRYAYVYGVALYSAGSAPEALRVLEQALDRHPYHGDLLRALISYYQEQGDSETAMHYYRRYTRPSVE
jgi:predicted CXXCH cytochrome family protein